MCVFKGGLAESFDELGLDVNRYVEDQHINNCISGLREAGEHGYQGSSKSLPRMSEALKLDAYASFRLPGYRYLLAGGFLSNFGLQMLSVAVSWDLYLQTHSALVLGNVGFVQVAPFILFSLISGHVADRYNRRRDGAYAGAFRCGIRGAGAGFYHSVAVIY